ncbi:MAG: hypothetical protein GYB53_03845 [Rhodobacteraceae bacterium]|nr:hypothetical protein [Paracoccaceae bacterium]MBR9819537.1 hypothetical protein [Paracoccaceae bacterium]
MDLILFLLPLLIGLIVAATVFRCALGDEWGLALGLPAIGGLMLLAVRIVGMPNQVPGLNPSPGPILAYATGLALMVFGLGGLVLALAWMALRLLWRR